MDSYTIFYYEFYGLLASYNYVGFNLGMEKE